MTDEPEMLCIPLAVCVFQDGEPWYHSADGWHDGEGRPPDGETLKRLEDWNSQTKEAALGMAQAFMDAKAKERMN